jgi:acyl dehydratase
MSTPAIGTRLPDLVRTLDTVALVAYAGATWDWYRTHYDATAVAQAALPAPIVDGQQLGAMLAAHGLAGLPPGSWPTEMAFRFSGMVFAGETVTVEGHVTAVDDDVVTLVQRVTTDVGTVAIQDATTRVRVPKGLLGAS